MIHLIAQLAPFLLLAVAFAMLAGWAVSSQRDAAKEAALKRERERVLHDIVALAAGENGAANDDVAAERENDVARRMGEIHIARIAELERQLSAARSNADSAAAQAAELQRMLEAREAAPEPAHVIEPEPAPAPQPSVDEEAIALQAWRLRYFEQRVRYLEGAAITAPAPLAAPLAEAPPQAPVEIWRARVAQAEAAYLADALRAAPESEASSPEPSAEAEEIAPFASNAEVDVLLRWRMLYLERRLGYLQASLAEAPEPAAAPLVVESEAGPDPDRWKWRARYLEARTRHLEQRVADANAAALLANEAASAAHDEAAIARAAAEEAARAAPVRSAPAAEPEPAPPPRPSVRSKKPLMLASARNGAPDDFTLIEGVTLLQQTTLYSIGVFHFDQIAAWTPENVAWVDQYLRLRGRIEEEEWVEQAADLAREGPAAVRRVLEDEDA
ncbi:MAG: hypothetical protein NVV62_19780 [Terricaulis sp.]|nr:hypothetical protein [Terricaulis sp.]